MSGAAATASGPRRRIVPRITALDRRVLLVLPVVVFLAVFFVYPTVEILHRSVTSYSAPEHGGLDNFRWVFDTSVNVTVIKRTVTTALLVTAVCILAGFPYAYLMTIASRRLRITLLGIVIITALMSLLVRSYAWLILLQDTGPVNDGLAAVGVGRLGLVGHTSGVVIAMAQILVPLVILPLYATMVGIDRRLVQAARSLGSGPVQAFLRVYLPMTLPGLVAGSLLVFVLTLGFYVTPTLVGSQQNALVSQLIVTQVSTLLAWGRAGALSLVLLGMTLLALGIVARVVRRRPEQLVQSAGGSRGEEPQVSKGFRALLGTVCTLVTVWLLAPIVVIIALSFTGQQSFNFPPESWSTQWYSTFFSDQQWYGALGRSLEVGVLTTLLATVIGTAAAFALVRGRFRGKSIVNGLVLAPLIVPLVIIGVGVYAVFLQWHLVGGILGFVLAHTVLAIPFVVIPVLSSLRTFDVQLEAAATSLGANPVQRFLRVTLPLIAPGILAGALFAFATSFDETVISLFIATATDRTLPVQMFTALTRETDPTVAAASTLILAITIVIAGVVLLARRQLAHVH